MWDSGADGVGVRHTTLMCLCSLISDVDDEPPLGTKIKTRESGLLSW